MWCVVQMLYDVGQILGGMVGGYISDKMGVRSPVVVIMLLFSWYKIRDLVSLLLSSRY